MLQTQKGSSVIWDATRARLLERERERGREGESVSGFIIEYHTLTLPIDGFGPGRGEEGFHTVRRHP